MSVSCGRALPNFHTITVRTMFPHGGPILETVKFEGYNVNLLREQAVDYQIEQAQVHGTGVAFQIHMTRGFETHDNPIDSETAGHIGELGE